MKKIKELKTLTKSERPQITVKDFKLSSLPTPENILWDDIVDGSTIIPKGTKIKLRYIWGFYKETAKNEGLSNPEDIIIALDEDTTAFECWVKLIASYKIRMEEIEAHARSYYFEGISVDGNETLNFIFGT